jgi:magnesium transporter
MLTVYKVADTGEIQKVPFEFLDKANWINIIRPTADEILQIASTLHIPELFLRFAFEEDSCPRIMSDNNCIHVIINVPVARNDDKYDTIPLSILLTRELIITVSGELIQIIPEGREEEFDIKRRTRFFFQILYQAGNAFLRYIPHIRQRMEEVEAHLHYSTQNLEVFQLLNLEKGLTYFTAALRANIIVLESILRMRANPQYDRILSSFEEDENIVENVIIENKRALELVQTHSEILSSMMDAFSSVIANNLNNIMRFLASITILLAIPTMISSFWSMSLAVPMQGSVLGFWLVIFISLLASVLAGIILENAACFNKKAITKICIKHLS